MFRNLRSFARSSLIHKDRKSISTRFYSRLYEPDYLELMKPKYPILPVINIQIKGYEFPILENYQKYLHHYAEALDLEVSECWATPPHIITVQRFKPNSAIVDAEYKLKLYERNIQLTDIQAPLFPVFLRIAQAAQPEGVALKVVENTDDEIERRYIPDKDLIELKSQLHEMGGSSTTKKK